MKIAIIGAGLSGITAAKMLRSHFGAAAEIAIFEKSRGAGGRMSTRRTEAFEFDHGAQYFTTKDPAFQTAVETAASQGHVARWDGTARYLKNGKLEPDTGGARYVSTPRMNSWIKAVAEGLSIQTAARISSLHNSGKNVILKFEDGRETQTYEYVITAIPSPQAQVLLAPVGFAGIEAIKSARMKACFAVMVGLEGKHTLPWDTLRSEDGPASWIAVNSEKPGRPESGTALMIHSGPEWSEANVDRDKAELQGEILEAAAKLTGLNLGGAQYTTIHRWLYASVSQGADAACLSDKNLGVVVCGDWCLGGRVEGAYLSGKAAAEQIISWSGA